MRTGEAVGSFQPLHRHADARVILYISGRYRERCIGECGEFAAGDVIVRPAHYAHDGFDLTPDAKYVHLQTRPETLRAFFGKHGWRAQRMSGLAWREIAAARNDPDIADDILARPTQTMSAAAVTSPSTSIAHRLDADNAPRLGDLAEMHNMSPWQLTRLFLRAFGMSPSRYRQHARAQNALRLLAETSLPLAVIAAQTGFSDQSHLGRGLRAATGATPDQLRRQLAA